MLSLYAVRGGVALLLLAGWAGACAAEVQCAKLEPMMERSHIPDVAVALFRHGEVRSLYCSASAMPLSQDAVFEAASLSKPVFALGVLRLVQEKRLDLDRPLAQYLEGPYEHRQNPFGQGETDRVDDPQFARITARMVLSHTSGLPNWAHHGALRLGSTPGAKWSYSGEGYVYLQRVVEAVTHEPAEAFLAREVLVPLGMTHSSFVWRTDYAQELLPGHSVTGAVMENEHYGRAVVSSTLYTTLGDYARFVSELLKPAAGSPGVVEQEVQVSVRRDLSLGWGLGVAVEMTPISSSFHWGANPGFQSFLMAQRKTGRGVLFLTDSDNGLDLVAVLVRAGISGRHPVLGFPMLHPKD